MNKHFTDDVSWLIFKPATRWYKIFLKKNMGHVFVLKYISKIGWIKIDPTYSGLEMQILGKEERFLPRDYRYHLKYGVIEIKSRKWHKKRIWGISILPPCVYIAKYIAGIKVSALTPWRLFKKLRKIERENQQHSNLLTVQTIM